jgi:hypothetical protein
VVAHPSQLRLVASNDFACAAEPLETSWGHLPGAEGLKAAANTLRQGQPTLWVDAGDFAQGGPIAPLSGGVLGFDLAVELGFDVAIPGNHEFDWGVKHLTTQSTRLGLPLICANADLGFPPTTTVVTPAGEVSFIGITHPESGGLSRGRPTIDPDIDAIVREAGRELRAQGSEYVVLVVHDGFDWTVDAQGRPAFDSRRFARRCLSWASSVDAIIAGHTLGHWLEHVGDVPVLQPWAAGVELGVVDFGRDSRDSSVYGVIVERGPSWRGSGAQIVAESFSNRIGDLPSPLFVRANNRASYLPDFMAQAVREISAADVGLVPAAEVCNQPPVDGVLAFLPSGELTEGHLFQLIPWIDDSIVKTRVTRPELRVIQRRWDTSPARAVSERGWWSWAPFPCGFSARERLPDPLTIAVDSFWKGMVNSWLGRDCDWQDAGCGLRQALALAISTPKGP